MKLVECAPTRNQHVEMHILLIFLFNNDEDLAPKSRITVDIITDLGNLKTTPQLAHGFEFKTWNRVLFFHKIL